MWSVFEAPTGHRRPGRQARAPVRRIFWAGDKTLVGDLRDEFMETAYEGVERFHADAEAGSVKWSRL